jgi:aerobic-type carbon monoxide dehydrogenase small subunit (CoxS/CutS family)
MHEQDSGQAAAGTATEQTGHRISVTVNGATQQHVVDGRLTLADFVRERLRLTGTHLGCEHGVCGACTLIVNGAAVRSCLMLAVQADGCQVETVEGLAAEGELGPLQEAFKKNYALQCGFCTPGFLVAAKALLDQNPDPSETEIRYWLAGNLCRCTGYDKIIRSVQAAAKEMRGA